MAKALSGALTTMTITLITTISFTTLYSRQMTQNDPTLRRSNKTTIMEQLSLRPLLSHGQTPQRRLHRLPSPLGRRHLRCIHLSPRRASTPGDTRRRVSTYSSISDIDNLTDHVPVLGARRPTSIFL